jgi:hypothetical protein
MSRTDTPDQWTDALQAVLVAARAVTALWDERLLTSLKGDQHIAQKRQLKLAVDAADALCAELWP